MTWPLGNFRALTSLGPSMLPCKTGGNVGGINLVPFQMLNDIKLVIFITLWVTILQGETFQKAKLSFLVYDDSPESDH